MQKEIKTPEQIEQDIIKFFKKNWAKIESPAKVIGGIIGLCYMVSNGLEMFF